MKKQKIAKRIPKCLKVFLNRARVTLSRSTGAQFEDVCCYIQLMKFGYTSTTQKQNSNQWNRSILVLQGLSFFWDNCG